MLRCHQDGALAEWGEGVGKVERRRYLLGRLLDKQSQACAHMWVKGGKVGKAARKQLQKAFVWRKLLST